MALDVAEDRSLRIIVVADLVFVDIDHGDVARRNTLSGRKLVEPPPAS
jgi:hypothetical protein